MATPMQPETLEAAAAMAGAGDSTSISVIETANGSHRFEIKGYSLSKGMGSGKYISSDVFSVGGYDWAIYFYPDGKNPEDNSVYVSVFIALASEGSDIRALFELTLLDQSGKGRHKVHSHFDRALESGPYTLKYRGSMWGYKRFLRRSALEASDFIKDDCLVMQCTVGVVRFHNNGPKLQTIPVPPSDICDNYKTLFESEMGCDVVFIVGDETFRAHKVVLACRSPVFKAQFFGIMSDPNVSEIVVEDIAPFIFKGMLHFIYTDTLPDVNDSMDCPSLCISTLMIQHLLAAADRYDLNRLKLLCESKLAEEINHKTVATTLAVADRHHCLRLKTICLKFIVNSENVIAVMQTDGFKQVTEDCPSLLEDLLKIFAMAGENRGTVWTRKRSASSVFGQDQNEVPTESANLDGRRIRRHVE